MKTQVYNQKGEKAGEITLSESVFGAPWNADLVHDVVVAMQGNARAGTAHAKDRSEVRGGGRKPWRQKGTGRARHGSRRSPIWTGGGVTFGPRTEKDHSRKINKNTKARALASVLSQKHRDGEVIFVDALTFSGPKAKDAKGVLEAIANGSGSAALATKRANAALILLPGRDENIELSFRNFGNVAIEQVKDINPVDVLTYRYLLVVEPDASLKSLEARTAAKRARTKAAEQETVTA